MKMYPIIPTLVLTALAAGSLWNSALAEEPSRRSQAGSFGFVPLEAYAKHREAIGLNEDQVRELRRVAEAMGDEAKKLEGERRKRTEALQELISQRPIELENAMERFQAVLKIEDEMKALQFRSGLTLQNMLTPEQAAKMQAIAAKTQGASSGVDPSAVREKLEQLKGELRKRGGGGELSREQVGALERIEQAAQKGNLDEARKHMEGLLAQLGGGKGDAPGKGTKEPGVQPSADDLREMANKAKAKLAEATDPAQREQLQQQLAKIQGAQDRLAATTDVSRREKIAPKSEGGNKENGKDPDRREKATLKDGESKEKLKQPGSLEKGPVKGEGEAKDKGKFEKSPGDAKLPDPELRRRVENALADFQEAKAAGDRDGMEKISKSIESLLRDSARDGGGRKEGERKEGAVKDGARKEGGPKDGERKEGAVKDGAIRKEGPKDGERKEGAVKDGAVKDAERKDGTVKQ